jgi:hypothetical protein
MKASLGEVALVLQHVVEVLTITNGRQPISIRVSDNRRSGVREVWGVLWPLITPDHGWIGDSQGAGKGDMGKFPPTHLIMSPTQHHVVQSTVRLVNTVLGRINGVLRVWVVLERVGVNDLTRKPATHDESISNDVPLALGSKEEQKFSQIVYQPGNLHPFRFSVSPNGLGGLQ